MGTPLAYNSMCMEIVETSLFTRQIAKLLKDKEYLELQRELVMNPLAGAMIRGSGGLRKLRWAQEGRGKSGGIRVIYYYVAVENTIFMLAAYAKGTKADLTDREVAALKKFVKEELA
jgi:hypothetical protein